MRENNMPIDKNIIKLISRKGTCWGAFTHIEDYDLGSNTLKRPWSLPYCLHGCGDSPVRTRNA
jgi:hypothetical protein